MQMKVFISYGDIKFKKALCLSGKMAKIRGGFDKVIMYGPEDIDSDFRKKNKEIFDIKRGAGLWLWKPYFIFKALLEECEYGDILFYSDSGACFIRNVDYILKVMGAEDVYVTNIPLREWQFSKTDAFDLMDVDYDTFKDTPQIQASFICLRKSKTSLDFTKEYLSYCMDLRILHPDNIFTGESNPSGFIASREDQTVLSLMCKKKGIKPHSNPSQFGYLPILYWRKNFAFIYNMPPMEYPIVIIHHRQPNATIYTIIKILVRTYLIKNKFIGRFFMYLHRNDVFSV